MKRNSTDCFSVSIHATTSRYLCFPVPAVLLRWFQFAQMSTSSWISKVVPMDAPAGSEETRDVRVSQKHQRSKISPLGSFGCVCLCSSPRSVSSSGQALLDWPQVAPALESVRALWGYGKGLVIGSFLHWRQTGWWCSWLHLGLLFLCRELLLALPACSTDKNVFTGLTTEISPMENLISGHCCLMFSVS